MRDSKGRFLKGYSGHQGKGGDLRSVRDQARLHTAAALQTLVDIMKDTTSREQARVAAAEALLNRAWGKPTQPVDHHGEAFSLVLHLDGKPS